MGLFSSSSTPSTPLPPNRASRSTCWAARDEFFACLDQNGIIDSIKNAEEADKCCGKLERTFQKDCAASWVTYFKQRRVMEAKKAAMMSNLAAEGAKPMSQGLAVPGTTGGGLGSGR